MIQGLQRFTQRSVNVLWVLIGLVVVSSILIYSGCGMTSRSPGKSNADSRQCAADFDNHLPGIRSDYINRSTVSITGTASDAGGGSVARVDVSVDGGATYSAATGTTAWSFNWTPAAPGPATIKSRASTTAEMSRILRRRLPSEPGLPLLSECLRLRIGQPSRRP
jgi:hypothetical protein